MKCDIYDKEIWAKKNKEFNPALLELLTSRDYLVILAHGKPPYKVVLGVPHQAGIGEQSICESGERRNSDENAASYALVAFSLLKDHDIPCKVVVAAHPTIKDPNKHLDTSYCEELFAEPGYLLMECHGAKASRPNE